MHFHTDSITKAGTYQFTGDTLLDCEVGDPNGEGIIVIEVNGNLLVRGTMHPNVSLRVENGDVRFEKQRPSDPAIWELTEVPGIQYLQIKNGMLQATAIGDYHGKGRSSAFIDAPDSIPSGRKADYDAMGLSAQVPTQRLARVGKCAHLFLKGAACAVAEMGDGSSITVKNNKLQVGQLGKGVVLKAEDIHVENPRAGHTDLPIIGDGCDITALGALSIHHPQQHIGANVTLTARDVKMDGSTGINNMIYFHTDFTAHGDLAEGTHLIKDDSYTEKEIKSSAHFHRKAFGADSPLDKGGEKKPGMLDENLADSWKQANLKPDRPLIKPTRHDKAKNSAFSGDLDQYLLQKYAGHARFRHAGPATICEGTMHVTAKSHDPSATFNVTGRTVFSQQGRVGGRG
jgi:hypothetical protein